MNLQNKVDAVLEELDKITLLNETTLKLKEENEIEQSKIVEQNITIKRQIEQLKTSQSEVDKQKTNLDEREKQILIKEKSFIASNRLLDEKLLDFRTKSVELARGQEKLQKDQEELTARKKLVDQQALINAKMEETETLRKNKIKFKEEQVDKELERLRNLAM